MTWTEATVNLGMTLMACVTIIVCAKMIIAYFKTTYEDDDE